MRLLISTSMKIKVWLNIHSMQKKVQRMLIATVNCALLFKNMETFQKPFDIDLLKNIT